MDGDDDLGAVRQDGLHCFGRQAEGVVIDIGKDRHQPQLDRHVCRCKIGKRWNDDFVTCAQTQCKVGEMECSSSIGHGKGVLGPKLLPDHFLELGHKWSSRYPATPERLDDPGLFVTPESWLSVCNTLCRIHAVPS